MPAFFSSRKDLEAEGRHLPVHAVLSQYLFPTRKSGYLELQGQELPAAPLQSSQEPSVATHNVRTSRAHREPGAFEAAALPNSRPS